MITPHFPPEFGWYGPGRDSMELALELSERGHQIDVIACVDKLGEGETYQDGMKVTRVNWQSNMRNGSQMARSLPQSRVLMNMNMAVWETFLHACQNTEYDIVDTCGLSAESLIPSLISECPVVTRVHDRIPEFLEKELAIIGDSGFRFEKQLVDTLRQLTTGCTNSVTTVGKDQPALEPEKNDGQLNYSLDSTVFSPEGLLALDTGTRPVLLVHTSIENEKYKGLVSEIVTRVKKEIPDLWLTIVAHDIYSELSESQMKEALAASGIVCDMVVNHNMSRLLMPGLWRNSWCGLILDWQGLSPYAVLEPLSSGTPIVVETASADMGFLKKPDVLSQPKEFTADLVAEKIISLLQDEKLRNKLGEEARNYIITHHCRKAIAEKILQSYERAIEKFNTTKRSEKLLHMERILKQCRALSDGFDQLLYDLLFIRSFRFRMSHWLKKFGLTEAAGNKEKP
jgi:hypothetical protein